MTTDHMELRLAAAGPSQKAVITRANLLALLDEFDALRAAGQPKRKAAAKKAAAAPVGVLPAWLPLEEWEAFLAMRVKIKKPATEYAQKKLIAKLERFMQDGMAPADVLDQSTVADWQDLYALKDRQHAAPAGYHQRAPRAEQQALANQEALARIAGIPAFDPNVIDMVP